MAKNKKAAAERQAVEVSSKTNKNFRLDASFKRLSSTFANAHERGAWRRLFIQAQLVEEAAGLGGRKGYLEMFKGGA